MPLYRIEKDHAKDCPCAKGERESDWILRRYGLRDAPAVVGRDKAGTQRGGTYRWLRLTCPANCPAVLLVNLEELERAVSSLVRKERGKK